MRLTILLIPFVFISCLPNRLVPYDFTIKQNNLEAFIEVDSVTVALINLKAKGDHYVFGLEVENNRSQPVFVDVFKIRKMAHQFSYRDEGKEKQLPEVTTVLPKEQVNAFFKGKQQDAEAAAIFLFLVGAAVSTYDVIKDEQDYRKSSWTREDEKRANNRDAITATTLIATDILTDVAFHGRETARTELKYLPRELFDREIIYPRERYFGKILFENFGQIKKHHRITFPIEGNQLHFDFRKATTEEREFLQEYGY